MIIALHLFGVVLSLQVSRAWPSFVATRVFSLGPLSFLVVRES